MRKSVAVLQSNYIPWKGYFDLIHDVDRFIFYDDVQYTKGDWRNRNLIKSAKGRKWLSIPVGSREDRLICEVRLPDPAWAAEHWRVLQDHYKAAPHFPRYRAYFEDVYLHREWDNLSALNQFLVTAIARDLLDIKTEFADSREYNLQGRKQDRLLDLLRQAEAQTYVSGPAAKSYINSQRFEEAGIKLVWKNYSDYPEYPQFYPPFTHQVTILDLLFQVGPDAPQYIWGHRNAASGT